MSTSRSKGILERGEIGFSTDRLSWVHWLGVLLAVVTGVIHLYLYVEQAFPGFLFAGIVFLLAAVAVLLNVYRRLLYLVGIPFTAGQIALWYAQGMPDMAIAAIDKPVQVALLLVLAYLFLNEGELVGTDTGPAGSRRQRRSGDDGSTRDA